MNKKAPDHELLFDEICSKLNELSKKSEATMTTERLEKMHQQVRKSQEELLTIHQEIQDKIKSFDSISFSGSDLSEETKRLSEQLDQERQSNTKIAADLAKSLELNLKLQFEIEEVKSKANQVINEERKHNSYLSEKNKTLANEMELSQALNSEIRGELIKAKESFQQSISERDTMLDELGRSLDEKNEEVNSLTESLDEFEAHSQRQNEIIKNLSTVAEKKMVELKLALDKKTVECQDYYSHLQKALTQLSVMKQENTALKEYANKMSTLQPKTSNEAQFAAPATQRDATQ